MTALILEKLWPYLLAGAGALLALWRVYAAGRKAEQARQAEAELRARDIRDQVDNDVSVLSPSQAREELSRWSKS